MKIADAAAALIIVENGGYLMQLRDARPDIFYPEHWGLFGGAIDPGEDPVTALRRELLEELELVPEEIKFFGRFEFDLAGAELPGFFRSFYVVPVRRAELAGLVLHEGAQMRVFEGADILQEARVVPYDGFALYLHHMRGRIA